MLLLLLSLHAPTLFQLFCTLFVNEGNEFLLVFFELLRLFLGADNFVVFVLPGKQLPLLLTNFLLNNECFLPLVIQLALLYNRIVLGQH